MGDDIAIKSPSMGKSGTTAVLGWPFLCAGGINRKEVICEEVPERAGVLIFRWIKERDTQEQITVLYFEVMPTFYRPTTWVLLQVWQVSRCSRRRKFSCLCLCESIILYFTCRQNNNKKRAPPTYIFSEGRYSSSFPKVLKAFRCLQFKRPWS